MLLCNSVRIVYFFTHVFSGSVLLISVIPAHGAPNHSLQGGLIDGFVQELQRRIASGFIEIFLVSRRNNDGATVVSDPVQDIESRPADELYVKEYNVRFQSRNPHYGALDGIRFGNDLNIGTSLDEHVDQGFSRHALIIHHDAGSSAGCIRSSVVLNIVCCGHASLRTKVIALSPHGLNRKPAVNTMQQAHFHDACPSGMRTCCRTRAGVAAQ
jgi:hypothetical protein